MSIVRSATVALSTVACAAALLTGAPAQAADRPAATQVASQTVQGADTSQRIASGRTIPGVGWVSYAGGTGLYIDVNTTSGHFSGRPTYTTSVGGNGAQWMLTGTSAVYSPTATGFRLYIRWSDGHTITVGEAMAYQWHVNWIGVDNP